MFLQELVLFTRGRKEQEEGENIENVETTYPRCNDKTILYWQFRSYQESVQDEASW